MTKSLSVPALVFAATLAAALPAVLVAADPVAPAPPAPAAPAAPAPPSGTGRPA